MMRAGIMAKEKRACPEVNKLVTELLEGREYLQRRWPHMDYSLIIAVIVLVGAIGGFAVLAHTLLENWRQGTRRGKAAKGPADAISETTPKAETSATVSTTD